ncbi:MAG: hypothetical protein JSR80_01835 [Verrucomicrobia bacterium]|nr:hypothetical protein [Verrucomicrobiota bacterium]
MNVDITALLIVFDELLSSTTEEQGIYAFRTRREDGIAVILSFSIHEGSVDVVVQNNSGIDISVFKLKDCSEINVLDEERKCLEILRRDGKGRCFISLIGDSIVNYTKE